jgi:Spy/CpxP family protein refolding chaperone
MSERLVYRPALYQQEMDDILVALDHDNTARIKRAVREQDAEQALAALSHQQRVNDLRERFSRMVERTTKPKDTQVPGQMTMEEFDQKKARAEAEERSDAIVDHYQGVIAD